MIARGARLAFLSLEGCRLEHSAEPALYASRLTTPALFVGDAVIISHSKSEAVRLQGARLGQLLAPDATLRSAGGSALNARALQVEEMAVLAGLTAVGAGDMATVRLAGGHVGSLDFSRAVLRNDSGPALHAAGLQIDQEAYFADDFAAHGDGHSRQSTCPACESLAACCSNQST